MPCHVGACQDFRLQAYVLRERERAPPSFFPPSPHIHNGNPQQIHLFASSSINFLPKNPRFGEGCPSSLAVWRQLNGHAKLGSFLGLHPGAPLRRGPGGDRGKVGWGTRILQTGHTHHVCRLITPIDGESSHFLDSHHHHPKKKRCLCD